MQFSFSVILVKNHNFWHSFVCNVTGFGLSLYFLAVLLVAFNSLYLFHLFCVILVKVQGSPFMVNSWSLFKNLPLGRGLASEEVSFGCSFWS